MRIILFFLLTLVLVGCGKLRLSSDEVGQYVFEPSHNGNESGWLLNTKTGYLRWCSYSFDSQSACKVISRRPTAEELQETRRKEMVRQLEAEAAAAGAKATADRDAIMRGSTVRGSAPIN